jgi:hypothetical protein
MRSAIARAFGGTIIDDLVDECPRKLPFLLRSNDKFTFEDSERGVAPSSYR